jgi:hypothetical protein
MRRSKTAVLAFGCAGLLACATGASNDTYGGEAQRPGNKRRIDIEVTADLRVSPDPVRLSKRGNHEAHWTLKEGGGPLRIEPEEAEAQWPLDVTCDTDTHCAGKIKVNAKEGSHAYRVVIGEKPGPDPVIIIEP